jgi:hypothetical protein
VPAQRNLSNAAIGWRLYKAWNRACLLNAWRATRNHFGNDRRAALELLGSGVVTMLALYLWGAEPRLDVVAAIAAGAAASAVWILIVLCWNFALAPYRLWRAARARITHLQVTIGRRIERHVIASELELRIREGVALMDSGSPSQSQLAEWYDRVLRVVSRAGERERAMLETSGPAPGTRGGALAMLILSNRIEKLRLILDRLTSRAVKRRRAPGQVPGHRFTQATYAPPARAAHVRQGRQVLAPR